VRLIVLIPIVAWIFHLVCAIRSRDFPWKSGVVAIAIGVGMIPLWTLAQNLFNIDLQPCGIHPRDNCTPLASSFENLFYLLFIWLLALIPLEVALTAFWGIRALYRRRTARLGLNRSSWWSTV